jgi:hypothetical protein
MGTFAETAMIDYCLSFADQEKTANFPCPFTATNGSWLFQFSFGREQTAAVFPLVPFSVCGISETWRH